MGGLVRIRIDRLLWAVIALVIVSLVNLGLGVLSSLQTQDLVQGQRIIQERVTPLCLSSETQDSCKRQIDSAKTVVVVRLCKVVHERLGLPRAECESLLSSESKRGARGESRAGRSGLPPPGVQGVGNSEGNTESGIVSPGQAEPESKDPVLPGATGSPPPSAEGHMGGGPSASQAPAATPAPVVVGGDDGVSAGAGAGVEIHVPPLIPPLVPKVVEGVGGVVKGVTGSLEGTLAP